MMYPFELLSGAEFGRINDRVLRPLRQDLNKKISMVGSASLPLPAVCEAMGKPATGSRLEGHPGQRYFPGSEPWDAAEGIAIEGIRKLFGVGDDYDVSIQPHSATQSNAAVWRAFLKPGDCVMGLSLNDGGHISHKFGLPQGVSLVPFPTDNGKIDYDQLIAVARREKPRIIIGGTSASPYAIDYKRLKEAADAVGAFLHADAAHMAPYLAAGLHPTALPYADTLTVDSSKNLRGPKGAILIYRKEHADKVRRAIFPLTQSSPNQSALLGKACMTEHWLHHGLSTYAKALVSDAKTVAYEFRRHGLALTRSTTDSHLIIADVTNLGITGVEAQNRLQNANILVNMNTIPGEIGTPRNPSGIRIGTTVPTILGYGEEDLRCLARQIVHILRGSNDYSEIDRLIEKYHSRIVEFKEPKYNLPMPPPDAPEYITYWGA